MLLVAFIAAQAIGLLAGWNFVSQKVSVVENSADIGNSLFLFGYILVGTVAILLLLKFYRGRKLFMLIELLLEFTAMQLFISMFASELVALFGAALLLGVRLGLPQTRGAFLLFAASVVGALLGSSLDIIPAVILSLMLAGYDAIAVFGTKHMVTMAKGLDERGAAFAVSLKHKKESIQLGTGDFVIPVLLSISALKLSLLDAVFVVCGGFAGLLLMIYVLERHKGYWPALPPIVGGALLFLLVRVVALP